MNRPGYAPLRMLFRPTVILFDLDGTLVATSGAGRMAIDRAFEELHGRADACAAFSLAGMTDRAIIRRALAGIGHVTDETKVDDKAIDAVLARYLERLDGELKRAKGFRVLDGVVALLDLMERFDGIAVGLGTGNVRAGAQRKLERASLWRRFSFGGFGDDHESRPELIRLAAERGASQMRAPVSVCRVVVIGDTALDVAAARANNFQALAVASGPVPRADLEAAAPDLLVDSLAEPKATDWLLDGRGGPRGARATSYRPPPKASRRQ
ncbi:MAG: HAD family hydrolase [Myxococcales bacterium]|nr:HAD family hydrolase [Myxococcales bacterium]